MRPDAQVVLRGIARSLLTEVAPQVATPFGQTVAGMAATLSFIASQEIDRMADRLAVENRAVVALLNDTGPLLAETALKERVRAAAVELATPDIRISTLQAANDRLRALLIDVHAAIEDTAGEAARAMEERIWDELRESTRRRHIEAMR